MKNKKGFTLIELLVVIAIIGLLSTLAVVALNNARAKARDTKRVADIKQFQTALELYATDNNGMYPECFAACENPYANELGVDIATVDSDGFAADIAEPVFMSLVPSNPLSGGDSVGAGEYDCTSAPGNDCNPTYDNPEPTSYEIDFYLEGDVGGGLKKGENCATQNGFIAPSAACPTS